MWANHLFKFWPPPGHPTVSPGRARIYFGDDLNPSPSLDIQLQLLLCISDVMGGKGQSDINHHQPNLKLNDGKLKSSYLRCCVHAFPNNPVLFFVNTFLLQVNFFAVFVFSVFSVFVILLVRSRLLITLIKCFNGHKSLGQVRPFWNQSFFQLATKICYVWSLNWMTSLFVTRMEVPRSTVTWTRELGRRRTARQVEPGGLVAHCCAIFLCYLGCEI